MNNNILIINNEDPDKLVIGFRNSNGDVEYLEVNYTYKPEISHKLKSI